MSLHGAGHLGFGLALTPEQRPKAKDEKEGQVSVSEGMTIPTQMPASSSSR